MSLEYDVLADNKKQTLVKLQKQYGMLLTSGVIEVVWDTFDLESEYCLSSKVSSRGHESES